MPIWLRICRVLEAVSPGVKLLEHEAHHSPPYNSEVKNEWGFISTPPYAFMI